jgi:hypothetical protein
MKRSTKPGSKSEMVRMYALQSFSGPEGATKGDMKGLIRAGQEFITTPERAARLAHRRMALRLFEEAAIELEDAKPGPPRREGPTRIQAEGPLELKALTIPEVMQAIESGAITVEAAMMIELSYDSPRRTLLDKLKKELADERSKT